MKRRNFKAIVTDGQLNIIEERQTFAWNSAIKATESIMRDHARSTENIYHGAKPVATADGERIYRRNWTNGAGRTLTAMVWEVTA